MAADFILDQDPLIPTGVPATPEMVAEMVADPDNPVSEELLPRVADDQRPSSEQLKAAYEAAARGE